MKGEKRPNINLTQGSETEIFPRLFQFISVKK